MEGIRVSTINNDGCDTFIIDDIDRFLTNLKNDPRIAYKYKKMDAIQFSEWIAQGISPKQFKKLKKINSV